MSVKVKAMQGHTGHIYSSDGYSTGTLQPYNHTASHRPLCLTGITVKYYTLLLPLQQCYSTATTAIP